MSELSERVERVRAVLAERPDGIVLGKFPPGRPDSGVDLAPGLSAALAITDGARGGDIVMFSAADVVKQDLLPPGIVAIGDEDRGNWVRFATLNYEPLLVHQETGEVWWFPDTGVQWIDSSAFERLAADLESFLTEFLLGDGYLDICVNSGDDWATLLIELGWASDGSFESEA